MKNSEYWQKRFKQLEAAQNRKGKNAYKDIDRQYRQAQREIGGKINAWYQRMAANNGVTMAEARKMLTKGDLDEFKWDVNDYIRYGKENAVDGRWMKQLENASAKYHISRFEALKIQTQQSIEALYAKQAGTVSGLMGDVFKSGYYHTAFELQKGIGIGWDIASIDQRQVEKILSKPWAADGINFSERIWGNKNRLTAELHNELSQNILLGANPQRAIDNIAKKLNVSKSNAGRLVMTELAYFNSVSQREAYAEIGVEKYEIVATLDSRTSEICRDLDGNVLDLKDYQPGSTAPPFHPWCRTTTAPWFEDDYSSIGERAARDEDGKTYYVPADTTYKHWYQKYIEPNNVTQYDKEAIYRYLGGESYCINAKLRDGAALTTNEKDWVGRLNTALGKMPEYKGLVSRSLYFHNPDDLTDFVDGHKIGNRIEYEAFSSFTCGAPLAQEKQIILYVTSKNGRDISRYNASEKEVLYMTNAGFRVLEVEKEDGTYRIWLEEVINDE
jgi:SPP1 gp7 family putative phage head morphogenesis protein